MRREELDKKLADKGWQSMQQTLDREMPVERKRRPVAWWWLGMLLLPLAIWGSQAWWNSYTTPTASPTPDMPAVPARRPVVQADQNRNDSPTENSAIVKKSTPAEGSAFSYHRTPVASPNEILASGLARVEPCDTKERTLNDVLAELGYIAVETVHHEEATTTSEKDMAMADSPLNRIAQVDLPLHPENTPALDLPETPQHTSIIPVGKAQKDKYSGKWSFGITAAASTEAFSSINGLSAGLSTDWHFARKWGVRASALYTRYRPSTNNQPVVAVEEYSYVNATGLYTGASGLGAPNSPYVNESLAEGYVYIPLRKLHQVEMPVMLWWQPVRPLRFYSGLAVDYTFMGQSAQQNYSNNQVLSLASDVTQKRASQVATSELPRWQMHYQGGVGFQLGKHADIGLFWHVPIHVDISGRKDLASYNSYTSQLDVLATPSSTLLPNLGRFVLQGTWKF